MAIETFNVKAWSRMCLEDLSCLYLKARFKFSGYFYKLIQIFTKSNLDFLIKKKVIYLVEKPWDTFKDRIESRRL